MVVSYLPERATFGFSDQETRLTVILADTAKSLLQSIQQQLRFSQRMTQPTHLLRSMQPSKRSLPRDSESKVSQPSTSSKTKRSKNTPVEELRMPSFPGFSRNLAHQALLLTALPSRPRSLMLSLPSPTSEMRTRLSTRMLTFQLPMLRKRSNSSMSAMLLAPLITELQLQASFSSELSRSQSTCMLELLTRTL